MKYAGLAVRECCGMLAERRASPARFYADELNPLVIDEGIEDPRGIGTTANAREHVIRQSPLDLHALRPRLVADDALEIPHHHRKRMRPGDRANDVMRVL